MPNSSMDREARLEAFWAADEPPAQDPAFDARVMERLDRRRLVDAVFEWLTPAIAAIAVLWAMWPAMLRMSLAAIDMLGVAAPLALAAGIVAGTYWLMVRLRLAPPVPGLAA